MPAVWLSGGHRKWVEDALLASGHFEYLASFAHDARTIHIKANSMKPEQLRFFLDSGAFSAWSAGKPVDIDEYIEFIKANIDVIDVYACLDVIPGKPGGKPTSKQRDEAAAATWQNYLYMKAQGLDPLPVYHYGEDVKWLHNMLEHKVEYIGLGGLVGIPSALRRLWLDRVFTLITDDQGKPIIKTHGFGMTSVPLVFRYPWYSVDSTSWIKTSQFGGVYLPRLDADGEFMFDVTPEVITVSDQSPNQQQDGKHVNTIGPTTRGYLDKWLSFCGVTLEEAACNYYYRARCNAMFFKIVGERRKDHVFKPSLGTKGLFY